MAKQVMTNNTIQENFNQKGIPDSPRCARVLSVTAFTSDSTLLSSVPFVA